MELGSLAEWVTGIAEVLAVIVALFLPIIKDINKKKKIKKRLYSMAFRITSNVLHEKSEKPETPVGKLETFKHFKTFISIASFTEGDVIDSLVFDQIENILFSIDTDNVTLEQATAQVEALKQLYQKEIKF